MAESPAYRGGRVSLTRLTWHSNAFLQLSSTNVGYFDLPSTHTEVGRWLSPVSASWKLIPVFSASWKLDMLLIWQTQIPRHMLGIILISFLALWDFFDGNFHSEGCN